MRDEFEVLVCYADYRQDFVAEIWFNDLHVAEVYLDANQQQRLELFYLKSAADLPFAHAIELPFAEFLSALHLAGEKLRPKQEHEAESTL